MTEYQYNSTKFSDSQQMIADIALKLSILKLECHFAVRLVVLTSDDLFRKVMKTILLLRANDLS